MLFDTIVYDNTDDGIKKYDNVATIVVLIMLYVVFIITYILVIFGTMTKSELLLKYINQLFILNVSSVFLISMFTLIMIDYPPKEYSGYKYIILPIVITMELIMFVYVYRKTMTLIKDITYK